jgi:hypothetical protein
MTLGVQHENIQNNPFGFGGNPPVSTWNMCRALEFLRSVEPIIKKKYRITC